MTSSLVARIVTSMSIEQQNGHLGAEEDEKEQTALAGGDVEEVIQPHYHEQEQEEKQNEKNGEAEGQTEKAEEKEEEKDAQTDAAKQASSSAGSVCRGWGAQPSTNTLPRKAFLSSIRRPLATNSPRSCAQPSLLSPQSATAPVQPSALTSPASEHEKERMESPITTKNDLFELLPDSKLERRQCPQGSDCMNQDPLHFILFVHTLRDEFTRPDNKASSRSFLMVSCVDNLLFQINEERHPATRSHRSLSLGCGTSTSSPTPDNGNKEKSGWLYKRAPLRKAPPTTHTHTYSFTDSPPPPPPPLLLQYWTRSWFVLKPQIKQLLYYKQPGDTLQDGKGPESFLWLREASVSSAPLMEGRPHCFCIDIGRKVITLAAEGIEPSSISVVLSLIVSSFSFRRGVKMFMDERHF